jgi:peptidoglycan-N-acetylglucosamine deacetylase
MKKKKKVYQRKSKNIIRQKIAFYVFIITIGVILGTLVYYLLDEVNTRFQEKQALSPLAIKEHLSSQNVSLHDGENTIPSSVHHTKTVVFHGSRERKQIALTFDADMTPGMKELLHSGQVKSYYDKKLFDILTQTETPATIFVTGMWIETYPGVSKQLVENPFIELGNHSYSHPSFYGYCYGLRRIAESEDLLEVQKTQKLLKTVTGSDNTLFRFPGGCYSPQNAAIVENAGLTVIQWDVAGQDGFNDNAIVIKNNIIPRVQNGSIIVLHFNGFPNEPQTANVLPEIIFELKKQGFAFVKVSDLLNDTAAFNLKHYLPHLYAFL